MTPEEKRFLFYYLDMIIEELKPNTHFPTAVFIDKITRLKGIIRIE